MKLSPRLAAFAAAYLDALRAKAQNPTPPKLPAAPDFCCAHSANYAQYCANQLPMKIPEFPDYGTSGSIHRKCSERLGWATLPT